MQPRHYNIINTGPFCESTGEKLRTKINKC